MKPEKILTKIPPLPEHWRAKAQREAERRAREPIVGGVLYFADEFEIMESRRPEKPHHERAREMYGEPQDPMLRREGGAA